MPKPLTSSKPEPRRILTGAVLRASALLAITQSNLAQILGLSPSTVSRMANGTYALDDQKKEWERTPVSLAGRADRLQRLGGTCLAQWTKQRVDRAADRAHTQH